MSCFIALPVDISYLYYALQLNLCFSFAMLWLNKSFLVFISFVCLLFWNPWTSGLHFGLAKHNIHSSKVEDNYPEKLWVTLLALCIISCTEQGIWLNVINRPSNSLFLLFHEPSHDNVFLLWNMYLLMGKNLKQDKHPLHLLVSLLLFTV